MSDPYFEVRILLLAGAIVFSAGIILALAWHATITDRRMAKNRLDNPNHSKGKSRG
ncbi:hypothetical protein ABLE91_05575 [Aquabacter sp. CN5-332]|uniref:hypothetical protein n=1 Tax=Aquabacter sp. CN5-332 TaxID=3156608 RepID=UPI0032B3FFA2